MSTACNYAIYETLYGKMRIEYEHLNGTDYVTRLSMGDQLLDTVETGQVTELTENVFLQIQEYLKGQRETFAFPMNRKGTVFQKKVWEALCEIPYGETRTYKDIAVAIGKPTASRAVGNANNKNPILIAVPCHRVIGANGKLVGYGAGLELKAQLLLIEKAHI